MRGEHRGRRGKLLDKNAKVQAAAVELLVDDVTLVVKVGICIPCCAVRLPYEDSEFTANSNVVLHISPLLSYGWLSLYAV